MLAQVALTYGARHAGNESWARELELLRAAVAHLTPKEVAAEIDISGSALADAMNERDNKRWAARWTRVVMSMLIDKGDDVSHRLVRGLIDEYAAPTAFVVEERQVMTPKELAAAYERELRRFGESGEHAISLARRGGRR